MKNLALILGVLLSVSSFSTASARIWTDVKGKKIEAHYLTSGGDKVILVRASTMKEFSVNRDKLSDSDKAYVDRQELLLTVPAYEAGYKEPEGAAEKISKTKESSAVESEDEVDDSVDDDDTDE